MKLPKTPLVLPADLRKAKNGRLPADLLVRIPSGGQLHHRAAAAWKAMRAAAAADGITLGNVGAYRTYDQQMALFRDRYRSTPTGSNVTRTFQGRTWWLLPGKAPSASPGTSNHGWGLAIDIRSVGEDGRLDWLLANAHRFGWSWELDVEPWHIRYVLGDAPGPWQLTE